jgi:NAD(P)-dependent dehydrogenase (short-subunit alcohol dehydrogenase family)
LPTYSLSKAALEAFSAIMAKDLVGTGVTVNVLVPGGGVTNTPIVPFEAGYDRAEMIQPAVMVAAAQLAGVRCCRRRDRTAFPRGALRSEPAAGRSRRQSRRSSRLGRYRDDADRTAAAKLADAFTNPGWRGRTAQPTANFRW